MTIDELVIEMALKTDKVSAGVKKVQNGLNTIQTSIGRFNAKLESISGPLANFVTGIGISFGQMFGGMLQEMLRSIPKVYDMMKGEVKALDELNKRTNASVEDISAWGNAIEISGGSAKAFQGTLTHLYNDLSRMAITGKGRSKPFLEALGIDVSSLKNKEVFDVLEEIAKAVEGKDTKKTSYALKNLGFDPDTIKFLQSGNIKEAIRQQKEWGVYTQKDAEAIDRMDKAIKRVRNTLKTMFLPLFARVIDIFAHFMQYVTNGMQFIRRHSEALRRALLLLAAVFYKQLYEAIMFLIEALINNPFAGLLLGLSGLLLLLEDLWVYAKDGKSAFAGIWKSIFGNPKDVEKGFKKIEKVVGDFFKFLTSIDTTKMDDFAMFFSILAISIGLVAVAITGTQLAIAATIAFLIVYGETIYKAFKFFKDAIEDLFHKLFEEWIPNVLSTVADEITEFMTNPVDKIIKKWEELKTWFVENFGSLEAIIGRATNLSASAQMAKEAVSGGSAHTYNDYSKPIVNITATTPQAGAAAGKEAVNIVSKGGKGVRP